MNYEQCKKQWETTRKRKLANNTYLECNSDGSYGIRLHVTQVIKFYPDKTVFDSGGYRTVTTKARINEFSCIGLWQEKGIWYCSVNNCYTKTERVVFTDGIEFDGKKFTKCGDDPKAMQKLRKQAAKYAKDFTKALFNGGVPAPSAGDCFYCSMKEVNSKKPLCEVNNNTSHLLNHFEENYFVPSLLVNAIEMFPVSTHAKGCIGRVWQGHKDMWGIDIATQQIESSLKRYCYRQLNTAS